MELLIVSRDIANLEILRKRTRFKGFRTTTMSNHLDSIQLPSTATASLARFGEWLQDARFYPEGGGIMRCVDDMLSEHIRRLLRDFDVSNWVRASNNHTSHAHSYLVYYRVWIHRIQGPRSSLSFLFKLHRSCLSYTRPCVRYLCHSLWLADRRGTSYNTAERGSSVSCGRLLISQQIVKDKPFWGGGRRRQYSRRSNGIG